ncbi:hypothetical protein L917_07347 [Phytophthora nicotianae]|uniref:Uncharacterized protein n=1 Tax=Phytophthora nicotianae TaxID=4792 RepID=W2LBJ5_PHYNI|nr:hypothetical protein L917_07347 [Phytophthora nicotianae]
MTTKFTTAELKRFRAFLEAAIDREEHGPSSDDADALKRQFWGEIRVLLGVNGMSTGLPHLDQLVEDVLQGKANAGLQGPIVILPAARGFPSAAPPVMTQSASPSVPGPASSNLLSNKSSGKKPAKSSKKPAKRKASTGDTGTKSSAKKPRAAQELTLPSFDYAKLLEVNPNAPRVVRTAIAIVLHKAEEAVFASRRGASTRSSRGRRSVLKCSGSEVSPANLHAEVDSPKDLFDEDLAVLHDKDPARYEATLENALNPAKVDAFGYPQVLSFRTFRRNSGRPLFLRSASSKALISVPNSGASAARDSQNVSHDVHDRQRHS